MIFHVELDIRAGAPLISQMTVEELHLRISQKSEDSSLPRLHECSEMETKKEITKRNLARKYNSGNRPGMRRGGFLIAPLPKRSGMEEIMADKGTVSANEAVISANGATASAIGAMVSACGAMISASEATASIGGATVSATGRMLPVGCVIMASGLGRRFGGNKLMADFQGQPLIRKILFTTAEPLFSQRVVVTRHPEIAALCRSQGIETILHELPGRNDTIRLGLEYLLRLQPDLQGCCFCPADQPLLSRETLVRLLEAFSQNPDKILRPGARSPWAQKPFSCGEVPSDRGPRPDTKFQPRSELHPDTKLQPSSKLQQDNELQPDTKLQPGSPVFFPRALFPELCCLPAGKGGSALIQNHPKLVRLLPVSDPKELLDVDTPEDLRRLALLL